MGRIAKAGCALALVVGVSFSGISSAGADGAAPAGDARRREFFEGIIEAAGSSEAGVSTQAVVKSPYAALDSQNDPSPNFPEGDITSYGVTYRQSITLSVKTKSSTNSHTGASWKYGFTGIGFNIDVNQDGRFDYLAGFQNDGAGNIYGEVVLNNSNLTHVCNATAQQYAANGFRVVFHRLCIGQRSSFRVKAVMIYDRYWYSPTYPYSRDLAPNGTALSPHVYPG